MKKALLTIAAMVMVGLFFVGPVAAADVTLGTDIMSAYVWRGITINDGMVIQPSLDVSYKGFGVNVWSNLDVDDYDGEFESGEFSEVDFTLSYGYDIDRFSLGVAYAEFLFPGTSTESTREISATVDIDIFNGLYAGLGFFYDIDEIDDFYASAKLGYAAQISDKFGLDFSALCGYANEDWAVANTGTDNGFHDYLLSATATYTVIENLDLSVYLNYADSIDDDVLAEQEVDLYGGVGLYYSF